MFIVGLVFFSLSPVYDRGTEVMGLFALSGGSVYLLEGFLAEGQKTGAAEGGRLLRWDSVVLPVW